MQLRFMLRLNSVESLFLLYAKYSANTARGCVCVCTRARTYTCVYVVKLNSCIAFAALQALFCVLYKY